MVIDGPTIIEKSWVTFSKAGIDAAFDTEEQIQPNGVDLRLAAVYSLIGKTSVPSTGKAQFDGRAQEVHPKNGWFDLRPEAGAVYLVDFFENISVPDGYCAQIMTRSTLVRSGVDVVTGLWDTGFEGSLGASLRIMNPIRLQYGARLAQIMFYKADFNGRRYSGRYQGANSQTAIAT